MHVPRLLSLCVLITCAAAGCADELVLDEEAGPDEEAAIAPTPEETGLWATGRYMPAMGAVRGVVLVDNTYYRAFAGDNSLLLWAMSTTRYQWSRAVGWADAIRDFLLDMEIGSTGRFKEGRIQGPAGNVTTPPAGCGPSTDAKVMLGVVAYTARFPNRGGAHTGKYYRNNIDRILRIHHQRYMAREPGVKNCPPPWNQAQGDLQRDYAKASSLALHLINVAEWARLRGGEFDQMTREAWALLKSQQSGNGGFPGGVLPQAKILYAMSRTLELHGNIDGLRAARNRLRDRFHAGVGGSLAIGGERSTDTQAAGFHALAHDHRSFSVDTVLANRVCVGDGHSFRGIGDAPRHPGPVEDIALGMLTAWRVARDGWADNGVCLSDSRCWVSVPACPSHPTVTGVIDDHWNRSNVDQSVCLNRARDYATWCNADPTTFIHATYVDATGTPTGSRGVLSYGCLIYQPSCTSHPQLGNRWFGDTYDNAHLDANRCMQRAADYAGWCGNPAGSWTYAAYFSGGVEQASTYYTRP